MSDDESKMKVAGHPPAGKWNIGEFTEISEYSYQFDSTFTF